LLTKEARLRNSVNSCDDDEDTLPCFHCHTFPLFLDNPLTINFFFTQGMSSRLIAKIGWAMTYHW